MTTSRDSSTRITSSRSWPRGRSCSLGTRPSRRVLTPSPLPRSTPPPSTCSPSTSGGRTPGHTVTVRSCTKAELRLSALSGWRQCGRRSLQSFQSVPPRSCQSGSESGQAKRLAIRRRPRVRRRLLLRRPQRRSTRRRRKITRRRRRKRSKLKAGPNFHHHLLGLKSKSYPCNKRHSIRVIASIPRGLLPGVLHLPGKLHNLQFVIAICLETRQVPVRICYALKIRSPKKKKKSSTSSARTTTQIRRQRS